MGFNWDWAAKKEMLLNQAWFEINFEWAAKTLQSIPADIDKLRAEFERYRTWLNGFQCEPTERMLRKRPFR